MGSIFGKLLTLHIDDGTGRNLEIEHEKSLKEQEEIPPLVKAVNGSCIKHGGIFKLIRIDGTKAAIKSIYYDKYLSW